MAGDSVLYFEAISQYLDFRYSANCWLASRWLYFLSVNLTFLHADRVWDIVRVKWKAFLELHTHSFSFSPGVVVANTHSVGARLLVWLISGLLAWTGASSFAELGSAIPLNGGPQAYLAYAYGPLVSYLFAWTAIIGLKPGRFSPIVLLNIFDSFISGGNAVISLIFAEYMNRIFWHTTKTDVSPDYIPQWAIKLTAVGAVAVITIICIAARKVGTRVAVVFTIVKVLPPSSVEIFTHMSMPDFLPRKIFDFLSIY